MVYVSDRASLKNFGVIGGHFEAGFGRRSVEI